MIGALAPKANMSKKKEKCFHKVKRKSEKKIDL